MARRMIAQSEQAVSLVSQLLGNGHNVPVWVTLLTASIKAAGMIGTVIVSLQLAIGGLSSGQDNLRKEFMAQTTRIDRLEDAMKTSGEKHAKGFEELKSEISRLVSTVHNSRPVVVKRVVAPAK